MDHGPWLHKEADRITTDLRGLKTDISLIERKYQVQMSDKDNTIILGDNEWALFKGRVSDCCEEMINSLQDFLKNEYHKQLHWSALRLMTSSGVLTAELKAYREKLAYIARHPSNTSVDVQKLFNWFLARVEPLCGRLSARLVQFISRVLDPSHWEITSELGDIGADTPASIKLTLAYEPNTGERGRLERERVKRLKRMSLDDD